MKKDIDTITESSNVDLQRRQLLKAAGAGVLAATFSGVAIAGSNQVAGKAGKTLRWGIVGTGGIANRMARRPRGIAVSNPVRASWIYGFQVQKV